MSSGSSAAAKVTREQVAGATRFVIGSAPSDPHDLVLGNYSVHTSEEVLRRGEAEIRRIGQKLRADGTLKR